MKVYRILKTYRTIYKNLISLKKGDTVNLGEEEKEEKWKGWIWTETAAEKGWIPLQILEIAEDGKTGRILEDYTAKELDADEGDSVLKIKSLNGWTWSRNMKNNDEGWIPDEIIGNHI
ncbi:MAG: hypothetical protein JSS91_07250 [Bacteroidetes bacterium]|nr:hypothetical protein [Bacteroidota bacterium]